VVTKRILCSYIQPFP